MSRVHLFLVSLVAALPAAFLTYLVAMMFVNQSENLSTTLMGVLGATAACGVVAAVGLPVMSLMPARAATAKAGKKGAESVDDAEVVADDEFADIDGLSDGDAAAVELADDDALSETAAYDTSSSDIDVFADSSSSLSDTSLSDTDLLEEDDAPKKKKKR